MRQIFRALCLIITAFLCFVQTSAVIAASAPALTRIAPVAIWSEETSGIPAPHDYPHRVAEGIVFRGENLYLRTLFIGYPAWATLAYRSNTETGRALGFTELARTPLTDDDRIIIGYEQIVMIPFAELGTAGTDICITVGGAQGGGQQYAYIRGIRTEQSAANRTGDARHPVCLRDRTENLR